MFFTQLYVQWQYKYVHVHKKTLNEKKCLSFFNKKRALYAGLGSKKTKTFSNYQATYQKELCLLFENQAIFFTEWTHRYVWSPPPVCFSPLFKDPPPPLAPLPPPHPCTRNALFEWPQMEITTKTIKTIYIARGSCREQRRVIT